MAFPIFNNSHKNILKRVATNVTFSGLKRITSISMFFTNFYLQ